MIDADRSPASDEKPRASFRQVVHSIPLELSRTAVYGSSNGSPRSRTTRSQNQSMSATDRRRSSSIVSAPAAFIKRVTFAAAIRSGVGSHAYSDTSSVSGK